MFGFARDSEPKRKKSKYNAHQRRVANFAKSLGHSGFGLGALASETWDANTQRAKTGWKEHMKKALKRRSTKHPNNKAGKRAGKKADRSGKRRGMPYRLTNFKTANSWLDNLIGVVKQAVAPKPHLRGSDYLAKNKVKLDLLEVKLNKAIVILKQKEADEDRSRAERAKAAADRKSAQTAKKLVNQAQAAQAAHTDAWGPGYGPSGTAQARSGARARGVGWTTEGGHVSTDKAGRPKKRSSAKKTAKKTAKKGRKLSAKTKKKQSNSKKAYWRRIRALQQKGMSLKAARAQVRRETKSGVSSKEYLPKKTKKKRSSSKKTAKKRSSSKKKTGKKRTSSKTKTGKKRTSRDYSRFNFTSRYF